MRPNILLILVDSARTDAYRLNGGAAEAPALERLAAEGVTCRRARATCPICHPSRASIITGLYPFSHGMLTNGHFASGPPFYVRPETPMLPELLQAAGYRTGYAGQMHIVARGWDEDRHRSTRHFSRWLKERGYSEAPLPEDRGWLCGTVRYSLDEHREGQFSPAGWNCSTTCAPVTNHGSCNSTMTVRTSPATCPSRTPACTIPRLWTCRRPVTMTSPAGRTGFDRPRHGRAGGEQRRPTDGNSMHFYHAQIT